MPEPVYAVVDVEVCGSDHTTMRATGRVSVCAVQASLDGPTRFCVFRGHVAGEPWPSPGQPIWVPEARIFGDALTAIRTASNIVDERRKLLGEHFTALTGRLAFEHAAEKQGWEPWHRRGLDPRVPTNEPPPKVRSAWDVVNRDDELGPEEPSERVKD